MDLFEYQGRDLFERHGLPVLGGGVAETPQEARAIAERLGGRVVVKAQARGISCGMSATSAGSAGTVEVTSKIRPSDWVLAPGELPAEGVQHDPHGRGW